LPGFLFTDFRVFLVPTDIQLSVATEGALRMFAVMGITGNVGGKVAETLLAHGKQVRGIVREPAKAEAWKDKGVELFTADYDDNLAAAFTGVEGIFVMIPPNMTPEPGFPDSVARIAAIKKAVLAAKPPLAVFLSSIGSEKESGLGLITATHILETELGGSGVPSAFLRPGSFMENIGHSLPAARATGMYFAFYQPLERKVPHIATEDIGRIGAETLLEPWEGDRVIEISGPAYYSSNDVAAALAEVLGQPVTAVAVPRASWVETLAQNGMPAESSGPYVEMVDSFNSGWIDFGVAGAEHRKGTVELKACLTGIALLS
jgi:NAD(P)H dehydrogenase (quinone)